MSNRPEVRRVRHETRFRRLTVSRVERLTPALLRVALAGGELRGFISLGFDDHVKLIFPPADGGELVVPGPSLPEGTPRPMMRDYTPRRYDEATGELLIDFVIHDAGPATTWAAAAAPGQVLGVGGPRGSMIIPTEFDWHLLIGDETALPAIGRRLEELPATTRALVVAEVDSETDHIAFDSPASVQVIWAYRRGNPPGTPEPLLSALRAVAFPSGEYFAWAAAETQVARAIRKYLIDERQADKQYIKAAGYWQRGVMGAHERIED